MNQNRNYSGQAPYIRVAGERESGVQCVRCNEEIDFGDMTASCMNCGGIHHQNCWTKYQNCGSYQCSQGKMSDTSTTDALIISRDDLNHADPLPVVRRYEENALTISEKPKTLWNKLAVWAFIISLIGIPLFGLVTGMVAMIVACIALVSHPAHKKGLALAVSGLLIGFLEIIGWSVGLYYFVGNPQVTSVALSDYALDTSSLNTLPDYLKRAMKSNVLIEVSNGPLDRGMGSGVVMTLANGKAYIVTNRHVIDHDFHDNSKKIPSDFDDLGTVTVQAIGQIPIPGKIEWIAPHGIDLALISAPLNKNIVSEAFWDQKKSPLIGSKVFAIGNPHALGWTHSNGSISQYRKQTKGAFTYQVIQTTTPLNPGNSGGGIYDEKGILIGINTMTGDKRVAEGLGFAISINTLLDLIPNTFHISAQQSGIDVPGNNRHNLKNK